MAYGVRCPDCGCYNDPYDTCDCKRPGSLLYDALHAEVCSQLHQRQLKRKEKTHCPPVQR